MELYLLTGFLGAGKTTSIKHLLSQFKDKKIALIINEFGKQGVDGKLLEEYTVELQEVNNGSIFCACKINKFEQVLEETIAKDPEIILIETSGLSDPTTARGIISKDKFKRVKYKGCITVVDAKNFVKVVNTVQVSKKQIRIADTVIINKIDLADEETIRAVSEEIYKLNPYVHLYRMQEGNIKREWLENLALRQNTGEPMMQTKDITLQKVLITISSACTYKQLYHMIEGFIQDTYRVKGFVKIDGQGYVIDCVGDDISIQEYNVEEPCMNQIIALSGGNKTLMKSIERVRGMYCKQFVAVER